MRCYLLLVVFTTFSCKPGKYEAEVNSLAASGQPPQTNEKLGGSAQNILSTQKVKVYQASSRGSIVPGEGRSRSCSPFEIAEVHVRIPSTQSGAGQFEGLVCQSWNENEGQPTGAISLMAKTKSGPENSETSYRCLAKQYGNHIRDCSNPSNSQTRDIVTIKRPNTFKREYIGKAQLRLTLINPSNNQQLYFVSEPTPNSQNLAEKTIDLKIIDQSGTIYATSTEIIDSYGISNNDYYDWTIPRSMPIPKESLFFLARERFIRPFNFSKNDPNK